MNVQMSNRMKQLKIYYSELTDNYLVILLVYIFCVMYTNLFFYKLGVQEE